MMKLGVAKGSFHVQFTSYYRVLQNMLNLNTAHLNNQFKILSREHKSSKVGIRKWHLAELPKTIFLIVIKAHEN